MNVGAINSHVNLALSINMGNQALIDAIRIVVTAFCEDEVLVKQWSGLLSSIEKVRGERNRIVHGLWNWRYEHPDLYSVGVSDLTAKGARITGSALERTPESLHAISAQIFTLIDDVQTLVAKTIPALLPPLRDAPRVSMWCPLKRTAHEAGTCGHKG